LTAYAMGGLLGALVLTFLVSRLFRATAFRRTAGAARAIGPNVATLALLILIGSFTMARTGQPGFLRAAELYALPALLWSAVDFVKWKRGEKGAVDQRP
jgi:hypothetical protein